MSNRLNKVKLFLNNSFYICFKKPIRILFNIFLRKKMPFLFYNLDKYPVFSWLDQMPRGWKWKFGYKMAREIQNVINEDNLTNYRVLQVKEKYGSLRWYDVGGNNRIDEITDKYEDISAETCVSTGLPAKWLSTGWICPYSTIAKIWLKWTRGMKFERIENSNFLEED